jgi:hypothetical protein
LVGLRYPLDCVGFGLVDTDFHGAGAGVNMGQSSRCQK